MHWVAHPPHCIYTPSTKTVLVRFTHQLGAPHVVAKAMATMAVSTACPLAGRVPRQTASVRLSATGCVSRASLSRQDGALRAASRRQACSRRLLVRAAPASTAPKTDDFDPQVVVVLGSQWGDEGKGKLVDILAQKYEIVARAQVR